MNSCSTDGNGNPVIYHKWYCSEVIDHGVSQAYNSNACVGFYIEFYQVNKFRIVSSDNCHEELLAEGTFIKEENIITVYGTNHTTNSQFTDTYAITELTKHNLTMNFGNEYYASDTGLLLPSLTLKYNQ